MDAQGRRDEIDERRFISDRSGTKELRTREVTAASMGFDSPPVVGSLQHVLAVFRDFLLDHNQSSVLSQRQQIDRPDAELRAACSPKLRV